jgi:hypothetical protein
VSVDWAIINKENLPDVFNVFALFYDVNIGLVHIEFQPTSGQAGEALEGYIQRWGIPQTIHHDNAKEFLFDFSLANSPPFVATTKSSRLNLHLTHPIKTQPKDTWK